MHPLAKLMTTTIPVLAVALAVGLTAAEAGGVKGSTITKKKGLPVDTVMFGGTTSNGAALSKSKQPHRRSPNQVCLKAN